MYICIHGDFCARCVAWRRSMVIACVFMHVYVYVRMCIYVYTYYICMYICIYGGRISSRRLLVGGGALWWRVRVYICMHMYMCICVYMYTDIICVCVDVYMYIWWFLYAVRCVAALYGDLRVCIYACIFICACVYTCIYIYYMYIYMYIRWENELPKTARRLVAL